MSRLKRIYGAVFDRRPFMSGPDLARSVVPVVSLTILSAVVGVKAGSLPDNSSTRINIAFSILGLCFFYALAEILYEAISQKRFSRSVVVFFLCLGFGFFFAPVLANISGNTSLVEGVLYG